MDDTVAAREKDEHAHQLRKKRDGGIVFHQDARLIHVEIAVFLIVFPEFFDLIRFPCKGFDGADTGEIFLCNGIHDGVFLADRIVDTVEFFFEADCDACDERKDCRMRHERLIRPTGRASDNTEFTGTQNMQNITQSWFVQGMIKATTDAWLKGWDERNGGNLTLRLDDADIAPYHDNFHQQPRYIPLSQPMPLLANTPFIVTGSGKFFRNVQLDPAANLGIVKVDSDGAGYHILWGLTNEAVPTSELPAHFLSHCERIKATNGKDRVIMHCHATNLIALTYVLENDTAVFTRQLWEGSTECLVVFPDGVGILPWMVPGTDEIGQATAQEMQKHSLVLWPFHGVFGSGPTLDETFGLIDTAEKSAQVLVKVYSMGGMKQTISREELIALGKRFGVTPLASALAL